MNDEALGIWTVYDHPRDFPDCFVARRSLSSAGGIFMTDEVVTAATLEELRALLPPGLYRIDRDPLDDPVIVEVWL
jgi:hypothetical protein